MSFSHNHERGIQPTTTPSPRDKGLTNPSGSPSLFKASLKAYKSIGKRDSRASGPPGYMPLGEHVNGLKNCSRQSQPRSDKNYQEIYTLPETPTLQPGAPSTPSRTRRTGDSTSTHLTTPSGMRAKRKRVSTAELSDSEDIVSAVGPLVRPPKDPAHASESSAREDQGPNGATLGQQEPGLFSRKPRAPGDSLDEEEFDSLIYGQTGASNPPLKSLFDRRNPMNPRGEPGVSTGSARHAGPCLHIRMDPRIHWTHPRSEEWHRRKQNEIRIRGTRKENFGKAAQRMQAKRLRDTLISKALPAAPATNDPGCSGFGRPVDFGDVPEAELPEMVKSNPEWLRAAAWMRKCRRKSLERQKEIEKRRKAGLPWKELLGASGIK